MKSLFIKIDGVTVDPRTTITIKHFPQLGLIPSLALHLTLLAVMMARLTVDIRLSISNPRNNC